MGGPTLVDNTAPVIEKLKVSAKSVSFRAKDGSTPLRRAAMSIDRGPWQELAPSDGILDGPEERFEVKLDALQTTGAVMVRVLVEDGFGHRTVAGAER